MTQKTKGAASQDNCEIWEVYMTILDSDGRRTPAGVIQVKRERPVLSPEDWNAAGRKSLAKETANREAKGGDWLWATSLGWGV